MASMLMWPSMMHVFMLMAVICLSLGLCSPTPPIGDDEALLNYLDEMVRMSRERLDQSTRRQPHANTVPDLPSQHAAAAAYIAASQPARITNLGPDAQSRAATTSFAPFTDSVLLSMEPHYVHFPGPSNAHSPSSSNRHQQWGPLAPSTADTVPAPSDPPHPFPPSSFAALLHSIGDPAARHLVQPGEASSSARRAFDAQTAPFLLQRPPVRVEVLPTFHASPQQGDRLPSTTLAAQDAPADSLTSLLTSNLERADYKVVLQSDAVVDDFIGWLRKRIHYQAGTAAEIEELRPVPLGLNERRNANSVAIATFWNRPRAKELLLPVAGGTRRLFVTFSAQASFLPSRSPQSFISIWHIAPPQEASLSSLSLHAFYPFTAEEFRGLARQPEIGAEFWISVRHARSDPSGLKLKLSRIAPEEVPDLGTTSNSIRFPEGPLEARRGGPLLPVSGLYVYVWREDASIPALLRNWCARTGLPTHAFHPIPLTDDDKELLNTRMTHVFRATKRVKLLPLRPSGETLMLCQHKKMIWLQSSSRRAMVSLWKFGPVVQTQGRTYRVLYAVGFYWFSERCWVRLNGETIPGLRTDWFQYNRAAIPAGSGEVI